MKRDRQWTGQNGWWRRDRLGLIPGVHIVLTERAPLNATVTIRVGNQDKIHTISSQVARKGLVSPVAEKP